ncbi:PAS domain S-box protein [Geotalea sp. SG265]|uniref:PAS domain S-box protein n=1 Tax=Geotalea sp. SG265 TaxID=2922867 RepID=UPI001FAF4274|nr:PAS domain S-box protein [Geotalea sp. SG265]
MSIKTKTTILISVFVSLLLGVISVIGHDYVVEVLKGEIGKHQYAILSLVAEQLDEDVAHSREMLEKMATNLPDNGLGNGAAVEKVLTTWPDTKHFNGGLRIIDLNGRLIAETTTAGMPRTAPHGSLLSRDYVSVPLKTGKPFLSDPYMSAAPSLQPMVTMSVPITRSGRIIGILAGSHYLLKGSYLADLNKMRIGQTGYIYLINKKRMMIMHPDQKWIAQALNPGINHGLDLAIGSGFTGTMENANYVGVKGISSFKQLVNADWIVAVHYPLAEAYAPITRINYFLAAIFCLGLVASVVISCLVTGKIIGPVVKLTTHVKEMQTKRDRDRFIQFHTNDELDSLAAAFNDMIDQMDEKQELLYENRELYKILADFTSELALLLNPDQSVRYVSGNCFKLTGYTEEEFYNTPRLVDGLIHPDDLETWLHHRDARDEDGHCGPIDIRIITKTGEIRWFNHVCHTVSAEDGSYSAIRAGFRDITNRIALDQKLNEQRAFSESIVESILTPVFVIDADHKVIAWNRAMADLTGCQPEEIIGTNLHWQPFYKEQRPTLSDLLLDGEEVGIDRWYDHCSCDPGNPESIRCEQWFEMLNGKKRYLIFDAAPIFSDGRKIAVVETVYDMTERKLAEESMRLFSQAINQSASSIIITDMEGSIQYVNRKFCEITGYTEEEILGRKPSVLDPEQQSPQLYEQVWQTVTEGNTWQRQLKSRKKDGSSFWQTVTVMPVTNPDGIITNLVIAKDDITELKKNERVLKKQQTELVQKHEELRNLFTLVQQGKREWEKTMDCIDDMIVLIDDQDNIRRCNKSFMEFCGIPYATLISSNWPDICASLGITFVRDSSKTEFHHAPTNRWFHLSCYPYGDADGAVITLHDLTRIKLVSQELLQAYEDLKSTHKQLLQSEKMASIGQLAAGVAHEINNPIGFISSNLGTMGKYLERLQGFIAAQSAAINDTAPADVRAEISELSTKYKLDYILNDSRSLLSESMEGAERVKHIVQNLKSFSRIDDAEAKYADIHECLESTIMIAWNELKYKASLVRDYGELPLVKCFPQQLNQVFLNLLINAAHAIEQQGEIRIATWCENKTACIAISDTGCGIPPEVIGKIFDPFFTTKEVGKGTGLGLSISFDIINKHKGTIEVTSEPGRGTTFTTRIPVEG